MTDYGVHKAHCFRIVQPEGEFMGCKYGPNSDCPMYKEEYLKYLYTNLDPTNLKIDTTTLDTILWDLRHEDKPHSCLDTGCDGWHQTVTDGVISPDPDEEQIRIAKDKILSWAVGLLDG